MKAHSEKTADPAATIKRLRHEIQVRQRELDEYRRRIGWVRGQSQAEEDQGDYWWLSSSARENHFRSIVDGLPVLITLVRPNGVLEFAGRQVLNYFGATLEELRGRDLASTFHPDDRAAAVAAWGTAVDTGHPFDFENRQLGADGVYRWFHIRGFPLRDKERRVVLWYVLQSDVDVRKRAEALLAGERRILEMMATGASLSATLTELCLLVQELCTGCSCCSVLLLDRESKKLWHAASPRVPKAYTEAIDGFVIGPEVSSCGTAAYHGRQVVASDIAVDPRWAEFRSLALANGLRACWSTPILSQQNLVLGTFAMFSGSPAVPTENDQEVIAHITHLASIAIEGAQSNAALKRSEARKTAILDSALDCIVTIDHEACITEFNPAAERTFGHRREDVVGKPLADVIVPPSSREDHRRGFARYLATGEARVLGRRIEMTAVRADGREFPVELAITRIPTDGPPSFTGYLRDITERKQSEEKLRESEAYLAEAQRLSHTGSWAWAPGTGEIRYWSEECYRVLGFDPRDGPPRFETFFQRVHLDDQAKAREKFERATRDKTGFDLDYRIVHPNGEMRNIHAIGRPVLNRSGDLVEFVGTVVDDTGRRLAENALDKAQAELAHVTRVTTMGELTASIAHEVNQPLAAVVNNANACLRLLPNGTPELEEVREALRDIVGDADRASAVIARIRQLASKTPSEKALLDLREIVADVLALARHESNSRRVTIRTEFSDELPTVWGDRIQLQQVLLNLVVNGMDAMSATEESKRVLIIRGRREATEGRLEALISVQDAGVGLRPDEFSRLFEAFYTTKPQGMGMGLTISRSIIEAHGGRLWAEVNEGIGATFLFSIPAADKAGS
jgi:PAS domain S-box-containing protein